MSSSPRFFPTCQAALAAWHLEKNDADATRFMAAFVPYCTARVRAALVHRHNFERYGHDAVQNILVLFLVHPALASAEDVGYWNTVIAHEVVDTIDETNGFRARRVFKAHGRVSRRFQYKGVNVQDIVPAGGIGAETPDELMQAKQTQREIQRAIAELSPLRRWAFIARQAEPLYLLTRREITLQAKRLKISRAALVALLEAHDPKSEEARLRLNFMECAWRGLEARRLASMQRAFSRATEDLHARLPHLVRAR